MRRIVVVLLGILTAAGAVATRAGGQVVSEAQVERGPRFLALTSSSAPAKPVDAASVPLLRRRITLKLEGVERRAALTQIANAAGLELVYSDDVLPSNGRVQLVADQITVAAALTEVLLDAGVDIVLSPNGSAALVKRTAEKLAQTGSIAGRVTDAKSSQGIPGVTLSLGGTRRHAATDQDGRFRMADVTPGTYALAARRVGYAGQSLSVTVADGQEMTVDMALAAVPSALATVVVTATGEQRLLELGHVVGRINADSVVREAPVSNLSELLTARVAGLQVFQTQGVVGGQVNLQIRGPNSISLSNEPIVIIDGVRYTSKQRPTPFPGSSFYGGPGIVEPTSPLNDINLNDVESIEVVKGPAAATLYGTDAANGVIVIATKLGRAGPARWHAYARGATTDIPTHSFNNHYWGWQTVGGVPSLTRNCTLSSVAAGSCKQDSVTVLPNPLNDPQLTIFATKPSWEYGMNVAGGQQGLRYYFSADVADATGPIQMPPAIAQQLEAQRGLGELPEEWREPNALTKLNLRSNLTAVGKTVDLRINTGYVHSVTRSAPASLNSAYNQGVGCQGRFNPTDPYPARCAESPAEAFLQTSTERTDRYFGSASGHWRPVSWLDTRATVGLDLNSGNRYTIARRGDTPHVYDCIAGCVTDERVRRIATTAELAATSSARRGRLSWRTSVGGQYVRDLSDALGSFGQDLPPGATSVSEAALVQSQQTYGETVTLGSYLEQSVGLNDRLFLTGALRADGASTFGRSYDAVVYPKMGASWLLSEEPFVPRLPGLDELRLRYAFGASGQQPDPAWARPTFGSELNFNNGQDVHVIRVTALGNPDLRPERTREHEFGFDATALSNRVGLEITWFRRRTVDQIVLETLPPGLGSIYTNLGLTTGHGFEARLTARLLDTRLVSWDIALQHGFHATELVHLGGAVPVYSSDGGYVEGYPLGARFQAPLLGYADANGDGIITFDEIQVGNTPVYMGQSTPPRSQTLTTTLGLFARRLRLSALLERRSGFTQINSPYCFRNCRAAVDPTTPLVEQAQRFAFPAPFAEPGDFTRLREVTVGMDVPRKVTDALRVRSATLALSGRNLALWTRFRGPDPESATLGGAISGVTLSGGEANGIPEGRTWGLRLDIGY